MKTKYSLFLFLFLFAASSTFAQLNIGKSRSPINLWVSEHKQSVFDHLKKTKTIFVLPPNLERNEIEPIIKDVWDFNEVIFVEDSVYEDKQESYISSENLIVKLIDNVYSKSKTGGVMGPETRTVGAYISFKFVAFTFDKIKTSKKGKLDYDTINIAEIFFTPNIRLRQDVAYSAGGKMKLGSFDKINAKHGEEPGFYNFNLGYIKNYFQELNHRLSNSQNLKMEDGVVKKDKLTELNGKTLYVPEWTLLKYNAMAASYGKERTAEELFSKYGQDYRILPNDEINTKILNGEEFYYLMHTQFNQKKIISVIHSGTGEIIYLNEDGGYNIKDTDLKQINKLIG
jgi:hypothetical protein